MTTPITTPYFEKPTQALYNHTQLRTVLWFIDVYWSDISAIEFSISHLR